MLALLVGNSSLLSSRSYACSRLLSAENADRGALATFAVDDALRSLTVYSLSSGDVRVLACSRLGVLHMYQCAKNGYVILFEELKSD
jgi:hypothetical protein